MKAVGRPADGVPDNETVCRVLVSTTNNEVAIEQPKVVRSSSKTESAGRPDVYVMVL